LIFWSFICLFKWFNCVIVSTFLKFIMNIVKYDSVFSYICRQKSFDFEVSLVSNIIISNLSSWFSFFCSLFVNCSNSLIRFSFFDVCFECNWFKDFFVASACRRSSSALMRAISELDVLSEVERLWNVFIYVICLLSSLIIDRLKFELSVSSFVFIADDKFVFTSIITQSDWWN
jgi:hypothetical protein